MEGRTPLGSLPEDVTFALTRMREARLAFLEGRASDGVRPDILRSWHRSRLAGVPATGSVRLDLGPEVNPQSTLLRAATPVAERLASHLDGANVVVHLANKQSQIIGRWVHNTALRNELDLLGCRVGCIVDEASVGTTALGTVAEDRRPLAVWGAEHYIDVLDTMSGAGAPIVHPGTGAFHGVVSIGCDLAVPPGMAIAVATQAALAIAEGLITGYSQEDRELLDAFLRIERRGPRRPVVAVNSRVLFANSPGSAAIADIGQAELWDHVGSALARGRSEAVVRVPGTDRWLELALRQVTLGGADVGAVVQIELHDDQTRALIPGADPEDESEPPVPAGTLWAGVVDEVCVAVRQGGRILLHGPAGAGKTHAIRQALGSTGHFPQILRPAAEWLAAPRLEPPAPAQVNGAGVVVLTRLDQVPIDVPGGIESMLTEAEVGEGRALICTFRSTGAQELPEHLLGMFDAVIRIPGLAERRSEIPALVARFLGVPLTRLGAVVRPDALRALETAPMPGNVAQLKRALLRASSTAGSRPVELAHLSPHLRFGTASRRLTPLERLERDAILDALVATGGNKLAAARQLELSRSTFYRRLQALDLDT